MGALDLPIYSPLPPFYPRTHHRKISGNNSPTPAFPSLNHAMNTSSPAITTASAPDPSFHLAETRLLPAVSRRPSAYTASPPISIIIPFWKNDALDPRLIQSWSGFPGVREIILAAAPGTPGPAPFSHNRHIRFIRTTACGRGPQMNTGAAHATGSILLFHHADTELSPSHTSAILAALPDASWHWGAFYRKFDQRHPRLRWLEHPARLLARCGGTLFGDQSIFIRRDFFQTIGGFAEIPLMEDVEFSRRIRPHHPPRLLDPPIASSPRRHFHHGPWKTTLRNIWFLLRFRLGACPTRLHQEYYSRTPAPTAPALHPPPARRLQSLFHPLIASLLLVTSLPAQEPWENDYAALLRTYATPAGVRYQAWHANAQDRQKLAAITGQIAAKGPSSPSREAALAYHLNAYNAWMLHLVLQSYPIESVRDIAPLFGVFTGKRIQVAGTRMSLNHLEKQLILPTFREPRVHFALNCASASCPPLLNEPFTAARLDAQLDRVTRAFLASPGPHAYQIKDRRLLASKIFDWYRTDFAPPGVIPFINRYRPQPLPANLSLGFLEYNWALNQAP